MGMGWEQGHCKAKGMMEKGSQAGKVGAREKEGEKGRGRGGESRGQMGRGREGVSRAKRGVGVNAPPGLGTPPPQVVPVNHELQMDEDVQPTGPGITWSWGQEHVK